jgi:hypothetical protein
MNKHTSFLVIIICFMACLSPAMAQKSKKAPSKKSNQKIELKAPKEDKKGSKKRDVSYYFEDGGIANPYNVIKFNPILLYTGDAPLYYERRLARFASIEVGAGVQLPYWKRDLYDVISGSQSGESISPPPTSGYSIYANPRIYLGGNGVQGTYIGFAYRQRNFKLSPDDRLLFTDYAVNYGTQAVIWGHFSLDYNLGIGMRSYKQTYQGNIVNAGQNASRPIYPFHLKIGYVF